MKILLFRLGKVVHANLRREDSPPASLEARKHGDDKGEELFLGMASKAGVLNEFLIGQELYRDRSGSHQGSGPMRNSFNVFSGGKKRQGRMRFSPCQLLRGSYSSSEAGGESLFMASRGRLVRAASIELTE
jgi:hypothetical protein